jgi:hypothetical protein
MREYNRWKAFNKRAIKILERHPHVINTVVSYLGLRTFLNHEDALVLLKSDLIEPVQEIRKSMDLSPHELHFRLHRIKYIRIDKDEITFQPKMPLELELDTKGFKVDSELMGTKKIRVTINGPITISGHMTVETEKGTLKNKKFVIEKYALDELSDFVLQLSGAQQNIQIDAKDK